MVASPARCETLQARVVDWGVRLVRSIKRLPALTGKNERKAVTIMVTFNRWRYD